MSPGVAPQAATRPLDGLIVGLSSSPSPDLEARGLSASHQRQAFLEIARYLLATGATIAYGGNLWKMPDENYTEALIELFRAHRRAGDIRFQALRSYLAWPLYEDLDPKRQAELINEVHFIKIPQDQKLVEGLPKNRTNRALWLTAMRQRMNREIGARVLLGGISEGFAGGYPGVVEETLLALRGGTPVYLLGAFGGVTADLVNALRGGTPATLTAARHLVHPDFQTLVEELNRRAGETPPGFEQPLERIDYGGLLALLHEKGPAGLDNGLLPEENERLFETEFLQEMILLLLKGLGEVARRRPPQDDPAAR